MTEPAPAPDLKLIASVSEREIALRQPGVTLVIVCLAQETMNQAEPVELALRARWAEARDVLIVHLIDLHAVPGMFRKMAETIIAGEHAKAVASLPDGQDPWDYVVILPDWKGEAVRALGLNDPSRGLGVAVISKDGLLLGALTAPEPQAVVDLVAGARASHDEMVKGE